jgi:SAM-dependent methyltransferase
MDPVRALLNLVPTKVLNQWVRPAVHQVGSFLIDAGSKVCGYRTPDMPPARAFHGGPTIYVGSGFEYFSLFKTIGHLEPTEDVLDIGCAAGRIAVPLFNYLQGGSYTGIDVVASGIDWASANLTPRHPNFRFCHADIHNDRYNPRGTCKASDYRFPFADRSFDFIFLGSVFTHLLEADAAHYLAEISRMLRSGGRLFGTWLLVTDEARLLVGQGRSSIPLRHPWQGNPDVMVGDPSLPEAAIGFSKGLVLDMHARAGLSVQEPIHWGAWCGRSDYLAFQDVVLAVKP